jgi:hypothetical protein
MKTWIVRAVDSGNIQRSPTFQAIFTYFFSSAGNMPFPIVFDSAGIDVDNIMADSTPATRKLDIINAGRYYDLLNHDNKMMADELVGMWFGKSEAEIPDNEKIRITRLYSMMKTDVHTLQMKFRNEALLEVGIPKQYLPGMRNPFRHDAGVRLLLPLDESVARKIDNYYKSLKEDRPITRIYGDLVGTGSLIDELTGGMETARKQVRYFMDTREKAMNEILKLLPKEQR